MKTGKILTEDDDIREILRNAQSVAVLGLSPKPARDSHKVAKYLKEHGYKIIPVRPAQKEILGERAYAALDDVGTSPDITNAFRRSEQIMPHAQEAIRVGTKVFWMQLGIENQEASELLIQAGIDVVMNRCIKVEHDRLLS